MSEDLIKRSDAIKAMKQRYQDILRIFKRKVKDGEKAIALDMIGCIKSLPSADRPQGEWIPFEYGDERWHKCTACGVADRYIEYVERPNGTTGKLVAIRNYCPHCGARMKGVDDE